MYIHDLKPTPNVNGVSVTLHVLCCHPSAYLQDCLDEKEMPHAALPVLEYIVNATFIDIITGGLHQTVNECTQHAPQPRRKHGCLYLSAKTGSGVSMYCRQFSSSKA